MFAACVRQDACSRAETSFKSLQFSRTSICGIEALENGLLRHQANAVPEVLDFDAILSGSHLFFSHSHSRSATEIRCQGLFANKGPPCQESLKFELWMKKYETSIGSIENSTLSRLKMRKRMKLVRMNTNEYEASAASSQ